MPARRKKNGRKGPEKVKVEDPRTEKLSALLKQIEELEPAMRDCVLEMDEGNSKIAIQSILATTTKFIDLVKLVSLPHKIEAEFMGCTLRYPELDDDGEPIYATSKDPKFIANQAWDSSTMSCSDGYEEDLWRGGF